MVKETSIPAGYKKTEVGVIPVDWSVTTFEDIADKKVKWSITGGPFGSNLKVSDYTSDGVRIIQLQNIGDGVFNDEYKIYTSEDKANELLNCNIYPNEIILSKMGDPVARACFVPNKGKRFLMSSDGIRLVVDECRFSKKFIHEYINSIYFRKRANDASIGSTRLRIGLQDLKKLLVVAPPLPEQQAIASALSDVDALITALEQLITKKRNIKQGAMQQLLTGKKRLLGFSGEWKVINMAENSVLKARIGWQGLTTAEYLENGDYYLVTGTDFVDGKINWSGCHFVDKNRYVQDKNIQLRNNDVLITKDGTIGKVGYVDNLPGNATLNSGVFVIRPRDKSYFPLYLYYVLKSSIFETFMNQLQAGSTISHLYQKDFVNFSFTAPPHDEQQAIAHIFNDMDSEIEALEQEQDKYRALKEGMMQELLTGKTRFV